MIYNLYYKSSIMIPSGKVDKKHLFDLDSDASDDDPIEESQQRQNIYES